jgi:hypothetical protein
VPQAKEEMDQKEAARTHFAQHSKGRCNRKEQRSRIRKAAKRIMVDVKAKRKKPRKSRFHHMV